MDCEPVMAAVEVASLERGGSQEWECIDPAVHWCPAAHLLLCVQQQMKPYFRLLCPGRVCSVPHPAESSFCWSCCNILPLSYMRSFALICVCCDGCNTTANACMRLAPDILAPSVLPFVG